jgi:FeS assembly SUF system protein
MDEHQAPEAPEPQAAGSLEERVVEALRTVFDPEIPVNIYELGLIYGIDVDEELGSVHIRMTLTSPACPVAGTLPGDCEMRVKEIEGVENCTVELVWDPPWDKDKLSEAAKLQLGLL